MRLTDTQRDVVARHLGGQLGSHPHAGLEAIFGPEVNQYIRFQSTPHAYALEALRVCEERWRQGDSRWCWALWGSSSLTVFPAVDAIFKVHRALLEQEDQLRHEQAQKDPFSDMLVCRRNVFLDRHRLRKSLKKLAADDGPSILVVEGPARSGRSYTRTLIQHIAEQRGHFQVAWNDCGGGPAATLKAQVLASTFSMTLLRPPGAMPEQEAQAPRWAHQLAHWVLCHDAEAGSRWWLVFDGFDGTALSPEARALIEGLAVRVATGPGRRRFRLVLLQYPYELPSSLRREVVRESLQAPDTLGADDVGEYFEWLFRSRNEDFEPRAIHALVEDVMAQVPFSGDRLQQLCMAVEDVTDRLLGGT